MQLHKQLLGVDISEASIEVVELRDPKGTKNTNRTGRVLLPEGVVVEGHIKDKEQLKVALLQALKTAKPSAIGAQPIVFAMPKDQVYVHTFIADQDKEVEAQVREEVYVSIPLAKDKVVYSYQENIGADGKKTILIVATNKDAVSEWKDFFTESGLDLIHIDIEALTLARALPNPKSPAGRMIVDIGGYRTSIIVFSKDGLQFVRTLHQGSALWTAAIMHDLKYDYERAETEKKKLGLTEPTAPISTVIIKQLELIIKGVRETQAFIQKRTGESVPEIVLVGGGSNLLHIEEYFKTNLGVPTKKGVAKAGKQTFPIEYLQALGLAMRGVDARRFKNEIELPLVEATQKARKALLPKIHFGQTDSAEKRTQLIVLAVLVLIALGIGGFGFLREKNNDNTTPIEEVVVEDNQTAMTATSTATEIATTTPAIAEEEIKIIERVRILDTPTGWLNVRSGPGTQFEKVGRINPGETYPLERSKGEWYNIVIGEDISGWVYGDYVLVITQEEQL